MLVRMVLPSHGLSYLLPEHLRKHSYCVYILNKKRDPRGDLLLWLCQFCVPRFFHWGMGLQPGAVVGGILTCWVELICQMWHLYLARRRLANCVIIRRFGLLEGQRAGLG